MSTYLYGVIRRPSAESKLSGGEGSLGRGVGSPAHGVRLVQHRDLAAVVSSVEEDEVGETAGVAALRRDMAAHGEVLARVLDARTVLPSRFGIVMPDDRAVVERLLAPQYGVLAESLRRLKGQVELRLTAEYVEELILRKVVDEQPQLARAVQAGGAGRTYQERIDFGRRVASAIRARRERDSEQLVARLRPLATDVVVSDARSDLSVLQASLLAPRGGMGELDRSLEQLQREAAPMIRLDCVGPLPPYSFVDVRVDVTAETAESQ